MNDDTIVSLFHQGYDIDTLTKMAQANIRRATKQPVSIRDAQKAVETALYREALKDGRERRNS